VLPGYYRIAIWLDWLLPGLVDWVARSAMRRSRR
jgi:hypothetical protein